MSSLPQNSVIGILGGGQLGRMCVLAAATLGYRCHVFAPTGEAPATDVAFASTRADYTDETALAEFASACDSVITEFENVQLSAINTLTDSQLVVCPGADALAVAQNRLAEKTHAQTLGIATPGFMAVANHQDLASGLAEFGGGILKTCRFGYDGKGQLRLARDADAQHAISQLATSGDLILEEIVDFTAEVSFLIARSRDGETSAWDATHNHHQQGILRQSQAPIDQTILPPELARLGVESALRLAESLNLVGLLAVEMFITGDNRLLFNEIAPRPHNSFHWTIEGATTSQFTQLIRIAANLPLASCATIPGSQWRMTNVLGEDIQTCAAAANTPYARLHRYGKTTPSPMRKMGHITERLV